MSAIADVRRDRTPLVFASFYFLYYFMTSANLAFLPLHFRNLGCAPWQIAMLSAGMSVASLFGSPVYGRLISHLPSPRPLLLCSAIAAVAAFAPLLVVHSFGGMLVLYLCYLIANNGVAIVIDTQAVRRGLAGEMSFERVRLWGSVGFVVASIGFGWLVERFGPGAILPASFASLVAMSAAAILGSRILGRGGVFIPAPPESRPRLSPLTDLPRQLWVVLFTVMLIWGSHGALYVYFSLYLRAIGWSGNEIALAWNIGVCAEICMFIIYPRLKLVIAPRTIFIWSCAMTMLRWSIISSTSSKPILLLSQVLHGWSFGLFYLSAITLLHESLPDRYRSRGQAWLTAWGSGAGSLGGRVLFGVLAGASASPSEYQHLFFWAVGMAACGCVVAVNLRSEAGGRLPVRSA